MKLFNCAHESATRTKVQISIGTTILYGQQRNAINSATIQHPIPRFNSIYVPTYPWQQPAAQQGIYQNAKITPWYQRQVLPTKVPRATRQQQSHFSPISQPTGIAHIAHQTPDSYLVAAVPQYSWEPLLPSNTPRNAKYFNPAREHQRNKPSDPVPLGRLDNIAPPLSLHLRKKPETNQHQQHVKIHRAIYTRNALTHNLLEHPSARTHTYRTLSINSDSKINTLKVFQDDCFE